MDRKELADAVRHCMRDNCEGCPLDSMICKNGIEAVYVPVELLKLIVEELADEQL
jgi:hypothetical protein